MGYTKHPTRADVPIEELDDAGQAYETTVRVLCHALNDLGNPSVPEIEKSIAGMTMSMIEYFTGEDYQEIYRDAIKYAEFNMRRQADKVGMTLQEYIEYSLQKEIDNQDPFGVINQWLEDDESFQA